MKIGSALKGLAKLQRSFDLRIGPIRASGVPAILLGTAAVVLAAGAARALARAGEALPETLREAKGLAQTLRDSRTTHLNP
ncbi:MAG: hypothetical protein HKL92_04160 [Candidatus Eremiobacteraeota bacterium]|uniref:Uncharacterized protein n=1 Tax=mine drainage metagenome TaxID=410659 RepID=E6PF08_9ZZZZ|nr:hypothetical protein [Candidatus Eremiobacteraeota bacterium]NNM92515.1 hypothetical protein [Candidatus Eremiobacteraeota bacterium]